MDRTRRWGCEVGYLGKRDAGGVHHVHTQTLSTSNIWFCKYNSKFTQVLRTPADWWVGTHNLSPLEYQSTTTTHRGPLSSTRATTFSVFESIPNPNAPLLLLLSINLHYILDLCLSHEPDYSLPHFPWAYQLRREGGRGAYNSVRACHALSLSLCFFFSPNF